MKVLAKHPEEMTYGARRPSLLPLGIGLALLLLAVAIVLALTGGGGGGTVAAERDFHDFGEVPLNGGLVYARFDLTMTEAARVTDIQTSCMCTRARIVQGEQVSGWFGMSHTGPAPIIDIPLQPGAPAYMEVEMDPAAHGPAGVGPVERGIIVETAGGQTLQFVLAATITP